MIPITPTAAAQKARSRSAVKRRSFARGKLRSVTYGGYNVTVTTEPVRIPLPRWIVVVLGAMAACLIPWILYLTFTLPSRHVTFHYDLAWVGFDIGLTASFVATAWAVLRGSPRLVPLAAVTGTMLVCDAWFDVVTSHGGHDLAQALLSAGLAELPLAALCAFIVIDSERFLEATATRFRDATRAAASARSRSRR